ncbi:hypothetical protein KSD_47910 [Ktedonobacter sp. SOSP1-85]|uniref:hypothetical protein n=1 Tax=Ktedonobacter sp. SOSP1-85 TaxID=2778367 RepID=UPI0019168B1D|nr:hypothetical protein [Ktedonobacter sp. SOSP1-85]GHO77020.1 hypothetical protein KSD_47910 [Ktedonobacter sp. SOSP1-85]
MFNFWLTWRYRLKWKRDLLLWKLKDFNERFNPYAQIADLTSYTQHLKDLLNHASCVCGKRLDLKNAYGCIECEHCHGLAIADWPHHCDAYLGDGHYWCKFCVADVACKYQLVSSEEQEDFQADPDIAVEWVAMLPDERFLHLVQEAEQRLTSVENGAGAVE